MSQPIPQPTFAKTLTLNFYLKHLRDSTISYILEQTGYSGITEYEILARDWDSIPVQITEEGFLQAERPQVDDVNFAVFELSLHHLESRVLNRIMDYYIGMDQLDYELLYSEQNEFYVIVPYKSSLETISTYKNYMEYSPLRIERFVEESDDEMEVVDDARSKEYDYPLDIHDKTPKPLQGWWYKLNTKTNNSYILYQQTTDEGFVYPPGTWNAPIEGLERPIYYNKNSGGWIVSLRHKDALQKAGARLYLE